MQVSASKKRCERGLSRGLLQIPTKESDFTYRFVAQIVFVRVQAEIRKGLQRESEQAFSHDHATESLRSSAFDRGSGCADAEAGCRFPRMIVLSPDLLDAKVKGLVVPFEHLATSLRRVAGVYADTVAHEAAEAF